MANVLQQTNSEPPVIDGMVRTVAAPAAAVKPKTVICAGVFLEFLEQPLLAFALPFEYARRPRVARRGRLVERQQHNAGQPSRCERLLRIVVPPVGARARLTLTDPERPSKIPVTRLSLS